MTNKHSKLPWRTDARNSGFNRHSIIDVNNESLAICQVMNDDEGTLFTARANAAFIVKCVNQSPKFQEMVSFITKIKNLDGRDVMMLELLSLVQQAKLLVQSLEVGDE